MAKSSDGRPREQEAVYTTIVGGRPPGCGTDVGDVPRGIEVLVKKAAVDAEFKALLLEARAGAAEAIALDLTPAEAAMLGAIPAAQLEAIISSTKVDEKTRPALLGKAAAVMIAALGVGASGCGRRPPAPAGIPPDRVPKVEPKPEEGDPAAPAGGEGPESDKPETTPDAKPNPDPVTRGIRPDRPPTTKGIRPDRP